MEPSVTQAVAVSPGDAEFALDAITSLKHYVNKLVIGQDKLIERMLIALLADGHLLVEGAPGLAKTRAIQVLSRGIDANFHRVQFTPDLLPADLTGTEVFRQEDSTFKFQRGPLFHNLILADEVNRAPAKVQAALLEAMAERQITVGRKTYKLPELFLVMATQNPIEQEGTYPLPEAQLDRFLLHVTIDYPEKHHEKEILTLARNEADLRIQTAVSEFKPLAQEVLLSARQHVLELHMSEELEDYLLALIAATRHPEAYSQELAEAIQFGASPRATIALDRCSRARAWLQQRDYVTPEDIQDVAYDILRHRLILSYEAEAEGVTTDQVISQIINTVGVP
ncbi:MAG: MoxR family ATPase [Gammaproteobacteria bacterium]|nr:MoxR family ATPase [Gammaproteobacteria bacterium]